jgi:DNA-binding CsgD family transcriptional regulator
MVLAFEGRVGAMDMYGELTEMLARVRGAASPSAVWASVKEFAARFGYSHLLALDLALVAGGLRGALLYSDDHKPISDFDREMLVAQHPALRNCMESSRPFLMSSLRDDPAHRGARWTEFLTDVVKFGEGLVIPVYRANQAVGATNFGGKSPDTSALTQALLQVAAHAGVERVLSLRDGKSPAVGTLSAREAQCLRHVAIGRPDAEIGQLLGISPRTVRFHVDSAKAKLGVSNRIQAVAKALRERIIAV